MANTFAYGGDTDPASGGSQASVLVVPDEWEGCVTKGIWSKICAKSVTLIHPLCDPLLQGAAESTAQV